MWNKIKLVASALAIALSFLLGLRAGKPKIPTKKLEKALKEIQKNNEENITDNLNSHFK